MRTEAVVEWKCERCGRSFSPSVDPLAGTVCSECKRVICRACAARMKSMKTKKIVCRDCAQSGG